MKSAITVVLTLLSALVTAAPQSASSAPSIPTGDVNFVYYTVPSCAKNTQEHTESHGQVANGRCVTFEWVRSIACFAEFNHSSCSAKFYSDDACSADKELPAPGATEKVTTGYETSDCWDDLTKLQGQVGGEDLVRKVNMTVTCA